MAKSNLTAEDLVLNIIINGDPGKKELTSLEKSIKDTRISTDKLLKEQKKLEQSITKLTKSSKTETTEYKEKIEKLDAVKKSIESNNNAIAKAEKDNKISFQDYALKISLSLTLIKSARNY